jgi:hypothetical protein
MATLIFIAAIAAVAAVIAGAGLGALAMVALGIHKVDHPDHQRLTDAARTPADAATRRVLSMGAHTPAHNRKEGRK